MLNRGQTRANASRRLEVVSSVEEDYEERGEAPAVGEGGVTGERDGTDADTRQPKRLPGYAQMHSRNREIGALLKGARTARDESTESVAKLIGTSRRRYAAMERGEALIGAVELEVLQKHFGIPSAQLWQTNVERGKGRGNTSAISRGGIAGTESHLAPSSTSAAGALTTPGARLLLVEVTPGEEILIRTKAQ